ncbi:unnamed protein product [Owenia fusiformis]|uniref:G-protein coupled receptors family 1 profile domain-containing protein n=1 Tax=Owenia fusiformis TaxID=6347 RepID=A0A8S4P6B0_OWEFU|nr:unnamed protein product [Owenia fusiformis]
MNTIVLIAGYKANTVLRPIDICIMNLAVIDLGMSLIGCPFVFYSFLTHGWKFGMIGCQLYGMMGSFLGYASINILTLIAVLRYIVMRHRAQAIWINTKTTVLKGLVAVNVAALFWSITPFIGWGQFDIEPTKTSCTVKFWDKSANVLSYIISIFLFNFVIPMVLILFTYCRVAQALRGHTCLSKTSQTAEQRITKIGIAITTGFFITWSPYAIVCFWETFHSEPVKPAVIKAFPTVFAKTATLINPIIYVIIVKRFRLIIKHEILWWIFGKHKKESPDMNRSIELELQPRESTHTMLV